MARVPWPMEKMFCRRVANTCPAPSFTETMSNEPGCLCENTHKTRVFKQKVKYTVFSTVWCLERKRKKSNKKKIARETPKKVAKTRKSSNTKKQDVHLVRFYYTRLIPTNDAVSITKK